MRKVDVRINPDFFPVQYAKGLTNAGIAMATGVTPAYANQVKTGIRPPSLGFAARAIKAGMASSFDDVIIIVDSQ